MGSGMGGTGGRSDESMAQHLQRSLEAQQRRCAALEKANHEQHARHEEEVRRFREALRHQKMQMAETAP